MRSVWASDLSYRYFKELLKAAQEKFRLHLLGELCTDAARILQPAEGVFRLFLRHDMDLDLARALNMADIESASGVPATYMVMTSCPLYAISQQSSRSMIRRIMALGHEIGLHFDVAGGPPHAACDTDSVERRIHGACEQLEDATGVPVRSISFHRPLPEYLRGPLMVAGRVNAYARELMAWYLSDSRGIWRAGEPLPELLHPEQPLLQLLIHPIWWGERHMAAEDRLQAFFEAATRGYSPDQVREFDTALAGHLSIRRRGADNS